VPTPAKRTIIYAYGIAMNSSFEKPEKPLRDDCCGGGSCCPCIWDVYYERLAQWKEAMKENADLLDAGKKATPRIEG
tara:strand:+ start:541 stop:771 length:231 start_codon:yes stop_codon:yes gene_type:complete